MTTVTATIYRDDNTPLAVQAVYMGASWGLDEIEAVDGSALEGVDLDRAEQALIRAMEGAAVTCSAECWTAAPCPAHAQPMQPRGRSAPLEISPCCEAYADRDINPRHLWNEHDSTRHYTDPEGWAAHVAACEECRG